MTLTLYYNKSPNNQLNKDITKIIDLVGTSKLEKLNVLQPSFTIKDSTVLDGVNYAYIVELNRYYYIDKVERMTSGSVQIYLTTDVLMTYAEEIKNCVGRSTISSTNINVYNSDYNTHNIDVRRQATFIIFENTPFTEEGTIVLIGLNGSGVV